MSVCVYCGKKQPKGVDREARILQEVEDRQTLALYCNRAYLRRTVGGNGRDTLATIRRLLGEGRLVEEGAANDGTVRPGPKGNNLRLPRG